MIDKLTKTYVFQLKVSDSLLFLLNATHPLDSFGDKCLSCIFAQGLPTSFLGVQVGTFTLCVLFIFFFFDLWVSSQYVGKCFKSVPWTVCTLQWRDSLHEESPGEKCC